MLSVSEACRFFCGGQHWSPTDPELNGDSHPPFNGLVWVHTSTMILHTHARIYFEYTVTGLFYIEAVSTMDSRYFTTPCLSVKVYQMLCCT